MKKYIIALLMGVVTAHVCAQNNNDENKAARQQKKAQRLERRIAEEALTAHMVDSLIMAKRFVLKANYLSNQRGQRVIVSSNINFIIVDSNEVVIQIASNNNMGGSNGLGGITATGKITHYNMKKLGKGDGYYSISFSTMTSVGSYDIVLNISRGANTDASISGITYGKLNYHGVIHPLEQSGVYKGRSI
jgi:hypothetical protein